ncbi:hypothetical protein HLY00_538, partial [Mycolicibacterium hippocampi]|nr:hypothetical protein [Mycolicibacterium hippocampi]
DPAPVTPSHHSDDVRGRTGNHCAER